MQYIFFNNIAAMTLVPYRLSDWTAGRSQAQSCHCFETNMEMTIIKGEHNLEAKSRSTTKAVMSNRTINI